MVTRDQDRTVVCISIELGRHINYDERMNSIEYLGQRSKVKVAIEILRNNLLNIMETEPLFASLLNLADMLTMVRG